MWCEVLGAFAKQALMSEEKWRREAGNLIEEIINLLPGEEPRMPYHGFEPYTLETGAASQSDSLRWRSFALEHGLWRNDESKGSARWRDIWAELCESVINLAAKQEN
jgi:hypothetical protein